MSKTCFILLLVLACLQLVGVALGVEPLAGLGAASAASPAPKVFTSSRGLEAFSSRYVLMLEDLTGRTQEHALTSERYAQLRGPYNRRNPYGAVLAFAPVLSTEPRTREAFFSVARFALCGQAPLLRELGLDPHAFKGSRRIVQVPRSNTRTSLPLSVEVTCP